MSPFPRCWLKVGGVLLFVICCQDAPVPEVTPSATPVAVPVEISLALADYSALMRQLISGVDSASLPVHRGISTPRIMVDTRSFAAAGRLMLRTSIDADSLNRIIESWLPEFSSR